MVASLPVPALAVSAGCVVVAPGALPLPAGAVAGCVGASRRSPSGLAVRFSFSSWSAASAFAAAAALWGVRPALLPAGSRQFARGAWSVSLPALVR